MKKAFLPLIAAAVVLSAVAAKKTSDPVVMNVNGKDVRQSEFEYLYNKNNQQQVKPQSIDEYVDMFVVYKLKVADAEAAGLDTTATFLKELNGYTSELARPYLRDTTVQNRLIAEAHARMATQRKVSHIMLPPGKTSLEREANRARLDSIRTAILAGASFEELAQKFSADRSVVRNNGCMGYISANAFPYPFEKASYETPVGQISEVIDDLPYGFHIIRVEDERPNPGKVSARHILKLTQGLDEAGTAGKKAQIDSIYTLLKNGADFAELAKKESEDVGSGRNGGMLGFFGPGEMVPEFEAAAFSQKAGEISEPFKTSYGYHIVQTLDFQGVPSIEEATPAIKNIMARDERSSMPEEATLNAFKASHKILLDPKAMKAAKQIAASKATPAEAFTALAASKKKIAKVGKSSITIADIVATIPSNVREGATDAYAEFERGAQARINELTNEYMRAQLKETNPDFRNIVNEYRDGILLFEISNKNVWDRAANDPEGLQRYFEAHRADYTWDSPRYKGYVIFATSDSIAAEAKAYLAANQIENDSLASNLRNRFGKEIKIEHVVAAKTDNPIIAEIAFDGPKAKPVAQWKAWFPYRGRVITAPEQATDMRGPVSTDFQAELERQWVEQLRSKYKVKINNKAISKIGK